MSVWNMSSWCIILRQVFFYQYMLAISIIMMQVLV